MEDVYEIAEPLVNRAASKAVRDWGGILEFDDIHQELWLFLLGRSSVQNMLRSGETTNVQKLLHAYAHSVCNKERVDLEHFSGNFYYSPKDVRRIASEEHEPGVLNEEHIDYRLGLENLEERFPTQFETLFTLFHEGRTDTDPRGAEQKRIERAFDRLADCMNDVRRARIKDRTEGPGTKPKEQTPPPTPVTDWGIYKQGVAVTNER